MGTNEEGVLAAGVWIVIPAVTVTADGTDAFFIDAVGVAPGLEERSYLYPASEEMPQVRCLGEKQGEAELIAALLEGQVDGVARGIIGNTDAADSSGGALVATAVGAGSKEQGGFVVDTDDTDLLHCLDPTIGWLTDATVSTSSTGETIRLCS